MLNKSKYCLLNCINSEVDFIVIPAQLMENICWNINIIKFLSGHHITNNQMDDNMINKLINLRDINIGIYYKKHIMLSMYDQMIHSNNKFLDGARNILKNIYPKDKVDGNKAAVCLLSNLYEQLFKNIFSGNNQINFNKGSIMPSSWYNFIGNTDARYYGHLWSKIISSDIYATKFSTINFLTEQPEEMQIFKRYILENEEILSGQYLVSNFISNKLCSSFTKFNENIDQSYYMSTDKFRTSDKKNNTTEEDDLLYSNRFTEIYSEDYMTENDSNAEVISHVVSRLNSLK